MLLITYVGKYIGEVMDIQFAILGLLSWQPLSGYDLKKKIAESDVFYWSGNNNQIYNNLIALHKAGLVSREVLVQESLPAKKIYSITEAGKQQLRLQLLADPELPELRNHFLIQLAWADLLSAEELDGLLAGYENEINVQLRMRQEIKSTGDDMLTRTTREAYLWRNILEHIASFYLSELEWVKKIREDLLRQANAES
jgi:PadR family transcriptional regulator, regulatory protein AphA